MPRVAVYDPQGRSGTMDTNDATGETFRPDQAKNPFSLMDAARSAFPATVDMARMFTPLGGVARAGQAVMTAPPGVLPAVGGVIGGIASGGDPLGAGLGASLGKGVEELRQGPANFAHPFQAVGRTVRTGVEAGLMQGAGNTIAGSVTGGALKLPGVAASPFGRMAATGAGGAAAGAALRPRHPFQGAAIGGGVGVAGQGAIETARGIGDIGNALGRVLRSAKGKAFGESLQQAASAYKQQAGTGIEEALQRIESTSPQARLSAGGAFQQLKAEIDANPSLRTAIEAGQRKAGTTLLTDVLDGKEGFNPDDLTVTQGQQLKAAIDRIPSIATKLPRGLSADYTPADLPLLDFKDEIRGAQLKASDQVGRTFGNYHEALENYRMLRPYLRPTALQRGGVPKLNESPFVQEAYKAVIPKEMQGKVSSTNLANKIVNTTGVAGPAWAVLEAGRRIFHK